MIECILLTFTTGSRGWQQAGEFVIVLQGAYHCGYNLGFNVAEACNFALPSWIPFGLNASRCVCRDGTVELDMRYFLSVSAPLLLAPRPLPCAPQHESPSSVPQHSISLISPRPPPLCRGCAVTQCL